MCHAWGCRPHCGLFESATRLDPGDFSTQNGLGNGQYALGDLDAAIAAYRQAIKLCPHCTAAHHDLAIACEAKIEAEPARAAAWREQALAAWRRTYELAPDDPGFSPDYIVQIGQRIRWLAQSGASPFTESSDE